ncbi:VOC family protein [Acetobacteraceae bacterium H6797]|nr:VOC family protein [Acetobacteraceae bacterium H6797]
MINHVSFGTNDMARAKAFYDAVFAVLGLRFFKQDEAGVHYGTGEIQFSLVKPTDGAPASPGNGVHIAFAVRDRGMVRDFHRAAMEHGGVEDGAPGIRGKYDAHYYAAFVRDPDGNKIEAVTHAAQ